MEQEREEQEAASKASGFIAELRHWREVAGYSQKRLAAAVGYTPSYVSKVEGGSIAPSKEFAKAADQVLKAGGAVTRAWRALSETTSASGHPSVSRDQALEDPQADPSAALIVDHEHAELSFNDGVFKTRIRRLLRNVGSAPVTRYLIRIAVDRYPGDPERSNRLYRENPLTWDEIGLSAACGEDEPMAWVAKHDRDAFKEVWLLFENEDGRYPLYPGESTWIEYFYTVSAEKWGPWWQRAIRLPTRRLSLAVDFPTDLKPAVWGMETSMSAEATAFRSPISREIAGDRSIFTWSTEDPPMHARYRIEWKFRAPYPRESEVPATKPSETMSSIGVAQEGSPILAEQARPFSLPAETDDARQVIETMKAAVERIGSVHSFAKGMGLAAPQIGLSRAAALVRTPDGEELILLNPKVIDESAETDEQYEGCLSFFDVRGMVPRPLWIEVEHQDIDGTKRITVFERAVARLVAHEIDHLNGLLYKARMRPGIDPIPVSQYRGTGTAWRY